MKAEHFKFLHILTYGANCETAVAELVRRDFVPEEHFFLLFDYPDQEKPALPPDRCEQITTSVLDKHTRKRIKGLFQEASHIVWHGIFLRLKWLLWLQCNRTFEKKYVWIAQSADLYGWEPKPSRSPLQWLKTKAYIALGTRFRRRISYFGSTFQQYRSYYEKNINSHGRAFHISYLGAAWSDLIERYQAEPEKEVGGPLRILVGVNASPLNMHIEILNSFINVRYENIRLYLPIGTGIPAEDTAYSEKVMEYAKLMYGEKVECITGPITPEGYIQLMGQMDIVVTRMRNAAVHCAFIWECVLTALCLGKKVYLCKESPMYSFLRSKNVEVQLAESIYNLAFEQLAERRECKAQEYLITLQADCRTALFWQVMFRSLESEDKPIRFLHIIRPSEELAAPIMNIVQDYFSPAEHRFLINRRIPLERCERLTRYSIVDLFLVGRTRWDRMRYLYRRLSHADYIIWHGLYAGYGEPIMSIKELLFLAIFPHFLKRTAWAGWGTDLYDWKATPQSGRPLHNVKVNVLNHMSEKVRRSVPWFISVFPPDGESFRKQFGSSARVFDGTYSNLHFLELLERTRPTAPRRPGRPLRIMVGHSANSWNYHMELLQLLARYRYENILVYIPLSTGVDRKYMQNVCKYGKLLFGEKCICITQKLPLENYIRFLWAMDVAVFRLERQAALGNLMNLMYMGKSIYLPANTVMYDFFRQKGVEIRDTNSIGSMGFAEFAAPPACTAPPGYVLGRVEPERIVEKWRNIFDEISQET